MVNLSQSTARSFVKVMWEIRFFPLLENLPDVEENSIPLRERVLFYIPPEALPTADAQTLLNLMNLFHSSSKQLVETLLQQAKSLEDFKEEDADKNFEIAKMISWIKMLQHLVDRLKKNMEN